jgi:hypothetical protein
MVRSFEKNRQPMNDDDVPDAPAVGSRMLTLWELVRGRIVAQMQALHKRRRALILIVRR